MPKLIKNPFLLLIIITLFGAILRFYRLPEMASFDFDQEYASNFAYSVLKEYPIQLIGQPLSVQGLFMGPLYFYYLVLFFALTNLHPIGGAIGSVILGLVTIISYFFIGKKIFNVWTGLIAAFFRAFLFTEIDTDWTMVPAYSSDLAILLTWFCLYEIWHGKKKFYIPLSFIAGLYTSFHPILFPFYLVFLIFVIISRKLPSLKQALLCFVAFLLPILPLIRFEFLHSFLEIRRLFELSSTPTAESHNFKDLLYFLKVTIDYPTQILHFPLPNELIYFGLIVGLGYLIFKKIGFWKDRFHPILFILTFVIFIGYYFIFPTHVPEYYFKALFTLSQLYLAACFALLMKHKNLWPKVILLVLLLNTLFFNIQLLTAKWGNPNLITLSHKDAVVKRIIEDGAENNQFYVSYIKTPGWNSGFNYLFKIYQKTPQTQEAKRPIYTIVIPKDLVSPKDLNYSSGNVGLIIQK